MKPQYEDALDILMKLQGFEWCEKHEKWVHSSHKVEHYRFMHGEEI